MSSVEEIEVTCFAELMLSSTEGRTASLESVESAHAANSEMTETNAVGQEPVLNSQERDLMHQASYEIGNNFQIFYNNKDAAILNMFTPDAQFGLIREGCGEQFMPTIDALSQMDNQGVVALWLDLQNINTEGESFQQFYSTFDGKKSNFSCAFR